MAKIKLTEKPVGSPPTEDSYFVVTQQEVSEGTRKESVRRIRADKISDLMKELGSDDDSMFALTANLEKDIVVFYERSSGTWTADDPDVGVSVYYGSRNVTALADYTITVNNVTGYWDSSTMVYTVTGLLADTGTVTISIAYGTLSIDKVLTAARLKSPKSGQSSLIVMIESSAGNIFKNRGISTILTAHVYYGMTDVTDQISSFKWYRNNADGTRDETWSRVGGNRIQLSSSDVVNKAVFYCEVEYDIDGSV